MGHSLGEGCVAGKDGTSKRLAHWSHLLLPGEKEDIVRFPHLRDASVCLLSSVPNCSLTSLGRSGESIVATVELPGFPE